jgi:hypothetical protein
MSTTTNPIFDQIEQEAQSQNKFIKVQPGQPITLRFDANKIRVVESDYEGKKSKRVEYDVINEGGNPKTITFSLSWALNLNELLKAGHSVIKVSRRGSGLDTSYNFVPV